MLDSGFEINQTIFIFGKGVSLRINIFLIHNKRVLGNCQIGIGVVKYPSP